MGARRMTIKNLTEDNISILISLCLGYAKIAIDTVKEENKKELWYNHMLTVNDILDRKNLKQKSEKSILYIGNRMIEAAQLDFDYFRDKQFSSYICSLIILEFIFQTKKNIKINSKFKDFDFKEYRTQLETGKYKQMLKETDIFLSKILDILEVEVAGSCNVSKPKKENNKKIIQKKLKNEVDRIANKLHGK